MLFLYIFSFLAIVAIVLFIWLRRPKPARRVEIEVPVKRDHYIYWLPWSNGWGGGNTTFIDRPRPHFAGISTEHARRAPRESLLD
jgi:hypothetical protein